MKRLVHLREHGLGERLHPVLQLESRRTRASSFETQLQPDGSIQTIYTTWGYDAEDRLINESANVTTGPDGLAAGFTLPAGYNIYGLGTTGTLAMSVDASGDAYVSSGLTETFQTQTVNGVQVTMVTGFAGAGAALVDPKKSKGSGKILKGRESLKRFPTL